MLSEAKQWERNYGRGAKRMRVSIQTHSQTIGDGNLKEGRFVRFEEKKTWIDCPFLHHPEILLTNSDKTLTNGGSKAWRGIKGRSRVLDPVIRITSRCVGRDDDDEDKYDDDDDELGFTHLRLDAIVASSSFSVYSHYSMLHMSWTRLRSMLRMSWTRLRSMLRMSWTSLRSTNSPQLNSGEWIRQKRELSDKRLGDGEKASD